MSGKVELHLTVPGLLGPMPTLARSGPAVHFERLERMLGRGRWQPFPGSDRTSVMLALFGLTTDSAANPPTAAIRRIGDGGERDERYWLQLTPVYLRPDQDRLLLFDAEDLELSEPESQALAELLNSHFAPEGWQVEVRHPHRWYLALDQAPDLYTHELDDVFGRNMDMFLPRGGDGMSWHGILNEVQMLFYQAPINEQREAEGKAPINGLWFSGGGRLPALSASGWTRTYGDSTLLRGASQLAKIPCQALPERCEALLSQEGALLVCYEQLHRSVLCADPQEWLRQLAMFEDWLAPLVDGVVDGRLQQLTLYPCTGQRLCIDRRALRRFWKRSRPLLQQLVQNA